MAAQSFKPNSFSRRSFIAVTGGAEQLYKAARHQLIKWQRRGNKTGEPLFQPERERERDRSRVGLFAGAVWARLRGCKQAEKL